MALFCVSLYAATWQVSITANQSRSLGTALLIPRGHGRWTRFDYLPLFLVFSPADDLEFLYVFRHIYFVASIKRLLFAIYALVFAR
jgi:hypothetical protein